MNQSQRLCLLALGSGFFFITDLDHNVACAAASDLTTRFAQPPAESRILKIIHSWPDQPEAQDQLIAKLHDQGFGGVVCNVSFNHYLESEEKWQAFTRAINQAKQAGMALWLYDERGYPSGNAGGLTLRGHPEWEARGLLIADTESPGGPITLDLPPGVPVLVAAFPVQNGKIEIPRKIELSAEVREKRLQWQAPPGRWHVMAVTENRLYEGTHAEGNLAAKMPYINLLMPEPTARFIALTHQAYAQRLGNDLGKYFLATFTDEPSLMSLFLKPMPYRTLPWAPNLPVAFQKRRGYALDAAIIPALIADAGSAGEKIRYDYWLTVGELVAENFFGQIQDWDRRHHLASGGHLLLEESIVGHVPLYGDFFRCIRRLDAPSIDCLTSLPSEVPWYIARLLGSAAELEGRRIVMCETSDHGQRYRPAGDTRPVRTVTETEIRGTCNRLMVSGVNCITSYYSFADLTDDQLRRLNEWVGRCCAMLTGGHQVADIAVLYPAESLWTKFTPSHHWTRETTAASRIENSYRAATDSLFAAQREFTFVDSRALVEAKVKSGALVHGRLRWRVLVLPGVDTLPLAAWEKLARFVRHGGVAIALGTRPANSERDFPSARVQRLANEIFGESRADSTSVPAGVSPAKEPQSHANSAGGAGIFLPNGSESLLPLVLSGVLEPDVKIAQPKSPLRVTHRRVGNREVYFVINDSAKPWAGEVSFAAAREGERWAPGTGRLAETLPNSTVKLDLEPYSAALMRFAVARPPQKRSITAGPLPNLSLRPVAKAEPTAPHGEFVRADLASDPAHSSAATPTWQATGVLTKSQVDTHLFLQFRYSPPLDLSDADCLVFDTWVPDGQKTPNHILVMLHEQDGGDFLASFGRSLSAPGRERSFVPITLFQLAGWSKDKRGDGVLDLKRVSDIRIGWGGYIGTEGEKVEFSVALPQIGVVTAAAK